MKTFSVLVLLLTSMNAHAIKLSRNLYGEWREPCLKVLNLGFKEEEGAQSVMYKMVVGWDGTLEYNYSYYSDPKCTKRTAQRREFAKYKVLEAGKNNRSAKIRVSKEQPGGMIQESIVDLSLSKINDMKAHVLSTKLMLDDILEDTDLADVAHNAGSGEAPKSLSRFQGI